MNISADNMMPVKIKVDIKNGTLGTSISRIPEK